MLEFDLLNGIDGGIIVKSYLYLLSFALGSCMGSFLTCFADRFTKGESIVKGRSHCDFCLETLKFTDLVPILSFIINGGKCKYCGAKLSKKYLITEIIMGTAFFVTVWQYGLSLKTISLAIIFCLLLSAALIDIKTMEMPDRFFIVIVIVWGLTLLGDYSKEKILDSVYGGVCVAAAIFVMSFIMNHLTKKETMGFGDIKLFFATGLYLGLLLSILNIIITCIIGMAVIIILKRKEKPTPLGPSIAGAFFITSVFGQYITDIYSGFFVF